MLYILQSPLVSTLTRSDERLINLLDSQVTTQDTVSPLA
jgi:hypothetical protein